ncbi:alpha/beta fold hydrolase [Mycobacterium sp. NPDC051804]|uniref:alpha/beta fold hydrolase n=1 Tax=Mycobacterium sp. NPDC051804 TaxID=3364295 RepID=UPI0037895FE0
MARLSKFRSDDARAAYLRLYDAALSDSPIHITESDVETSFGSTHVLHAGDRSKPSVVTLHGSSISSTSWVPLLGALTASHSVTMIDVIDEAGKSIAAKPTKSITDIVTWLDETMRALDVQRSSFVAASRGTWISAHYATVFPEKVERLALLCPVGIAGGMSPSFMVRGLAPLVLPLKERHVWRVLDTMVVPENRKLLRQQPWMPSMHQFVCGAINFKMSFRNAQPRPWPLRSDCDLYRLKTIPVLAVIGRDESALNGPKSAGMLRESLPNARIEVVDDANHMVMVDQAAAVQKLLVEFLGE